MSGLRVGVAGLGFGSTVHVPAFRSEGWEIPVVWSRTRARAEEQATVHGIAEATDDYAALLARPDLDAIAIATPPAAHYEMTMAALAAGKHVLCEKPFALDARQAREMRDAARASGLTAMVAHEFRHSGQRSYVQELIEAGFVGRPQLVRVELFMGRPRPETPPPLTAAASAAQGGGMLGALGSHYIDGLRAWFGDVQRVSGLLRTLRPDRLDAASGRVVQADAEDTFEFTLHFANGVVASMIASSAVATGGGGRVTVIGSDGVLATTQRGPNPDPHGTVLGATAGEAALTERPIPERHLPFEDERDDRLVAFRLLVRDFERGIREHTSPAPSFDDALACQRVLDAIREAARTGTTVAVARD